MEVIKKSVLPFESKKRIFLQLAAALILGISLGLIGIPLSFYEPAMLTCDSLGCPEPEPAKIKWLSLSFNVLFWHLISGLIYVKGFKDRN